jgi:hypothetical protein
MAGDGVGAGGAGRSTVRVCGALEGVVPSTGGRTGAVWGRDGVTTAGWSAWRVTVPLRLKFCSSLGPIVSGEVEFVVGAGVEVLWASASVGAAAKAAATKTALRREIAVIPLRISK